MNDFSTAPYRAAYEQEADVRKTVADWLERDTGEGMEQFTRIIASMYAERVFEDRPAGDRLAVYLVHPPITPEGLPTPDIGAVMSDPVYGQPPVDPMTGMPAMDPMTGQPVPPPVIQKPQEVRPAVFPQWTTLAAEFPAYFVMLCADAEDLLTRWQKGTLKPAEATA